MAVGFLAIVTIGVALPVIWMTSRVAQEGPSVEIPAEQQQEFDRKRRMLEEARILLDAGAYEQALDRYNRILAEFPDTATAIKGREEARKHLE